MIIGICGAAGSGKDTVGDYLIENWNLTPNMHWMKYSMALPLKRGLSEMLNIPMDDINDVNLKNTVSYKFGKSIRFMLQTLGTEWARERIADDIWVQIGRESIEGFVKMASLENKPYNVVICDVRFDNEADMIHDMGGMIIRIDRPSNKYTEDVVKNGVESHESESGISLDKIDVVIENDSTKDNLFELVESEIMVFCND